MGGCTNRALKDGKARRNDEFYTLMNDIENELSQYDISQFKDKIVYCNCDDPTWSNFFKFFVKWGKRLGIREARFTNFANGQRQFQQLSLFEKNDLVESVEDDKKGTAHYWIYTPATNKIIKKELIGDGDFRSAECVKFLKQADIVITNPPFSLFREYVEQLIEYRKKFLIIGDINARTYKNFFEFIKSNQIWCGYTQVKNFQTIDGIATFGNKCWYTNLQTIARDTPLILHPQDLSNFVKYDNYDAVEIPNIKLIPDNYYGNMGVPITFIEKYCPKQFEIIGFTHRNDPYNLKTKIYTKLDGNNFNDLNGSPIIKNGDEYRFVYMRIIIKRKGEAK